MLTEPIYIQSDKGSLLQDEIDGKIEFRNVSFKYPGSDEYALKNINLTIEAGSNIAIVGRTGSGKTTLVNLIPRLFDPDEGEILIDGKNIKRWDLQHHY